jgi:hypothetical protein
MRHLTIDAYLDELSARIPAPGGGACAALHAAQAAALTAMVSRYSSGEKFAPHKAAIDGSAPNQTSSCARRRSLPTTMRLRSAPWPLPTSFPGQMSRRRQSGLRPSPRRWKRPLIGISAQPA